MDALAQYTRHFVRETVEVHTVDLGYRVCLNDEVICTYSPDHFNMAYECKKRLKLIFEGENARVRIDVLVAAYDYRTDDVGLRRWIEGEEAWT